MSIFASYVTRTIPVPFDPPHEVTIQKLTARQLAAARQAAVVTSMDFVKQMGGPAFGRELASATADAPTTAAAVAAVQADPLRQYDRFAVIAKGVTGWTYDRPLTPDVLDDLDDQTVDFLAREILTLTLPNGNAEKKSNS